jgi:hypothetical protein
MESNVSLLIGEYSPPLLWVNSVALEHAND